MAIGRALFGNTSSQSQSKNLVEFRAGKMDLKGTTVTPDKRKGLVYIHQTDDSLMHFCWKDRTAGSVVDDLIIFPDDVEYKRVPQCTTGRVYVLKFKSTNRKLFFWMQEPKTDKDEEYCKKVNEYLNNPPALGSNRSGGSTPGGLPSELSNLSNLVSDGSDIQTLLNNMSQQQLMQLFGNVSGMSGVGNLSSLLGSRSSAAPSSTASSRSTSASIRTESATPVTTAPVTPSTVSTPATTAPTTATVTPAVTPSATPTTPSTATPAAAAAASSGNIQLSDLQSILSGIRIPAPEGEDAQNRTPIDLSTAINVEALQPVLNNPEFLQRLQSLIPQGDTPTSQNLEQVRETLQSPQFQQAISMFSAGLQSGQLGPLMQQFGLPEETIAAAAQGDMDTFVRALQESIAKQNAGKDDKESKKEGDPPPKKDDDDEDMALG